MKLMFVTCSFAAAGLFLSHPVQAEGPIVFLGDSLTWGGEWPKRFPDLPIINQGIPGDTTQGILRRLDRTIDRSPSKIFLMAGINDLWNGGNASDTADRFKLIVERIDTSLPDTRLYIQSVLPINNDLVGPLIRNRDIRYLNERLQVLADEIEAVYINLAPIFQGSDGQLKPELTTDGVHLTPRAYRLWQSHIEKDLQP